MNEAYSKVIKREDSIFFLVSNNDPEKSIVIGPHEHCGYVLLLNTASSISKNNCQSKMITFKGIPKVIIFTSRVIKEGQELTYCYTTNKNQFGWKDLKQENDLEIIEEEQTNR